MCAELQCEVERLGGCIHESQAERSSLLGRLRAATEQLDETARQRDSLQKRQVCLGDSPEASVRIADLQRQVQTLQEQLQSSRLQGQQREEGRLGCGVEGRAGCGVEGRPGCGVCLLVIICCGYSELKKSLEEMAVKLTMPSAELVGTIQCSVLCCG